MSTFCQPASTPELQTLRPTQTRQPRFNEISFELWSRLQVSPLITPIVVSFIIPYNTHLRSLDYGSCRSFLWVSGLCRLPPVPSIHPNSPPTQPTQSIQGWLGWILVSSKLQSLNSSRCPPPLPPPHRPLIPCTTPNPPALPQPSTPCTLDQNLSSDLLEVASIFSSETLINL